MATWLRRAVPIAAAALVLLIAKLLEPLTDHPWSPAVVPALVVSTLAAGRTGGLSALALAAAGRILWISPAPWTRPVWMTSWLVIHLLTVAITDALRRARAERIEGRRVHREQVTRAAKVIASRRAEFLAHASDVLASSPDYQATLAAVANLAVPQIADLCVVDIVTEDGQFTPLAIAHADPRKVELVRELRQLYPLDPKAPYGPPRALRSGRSLIYSELPDSVATDTHVDPSELRVAVALGIRSTLAVPLLVGGRRLGVISFATTDSGRKFVESDVQFAEDLARRAAIAIDTARP